MSMLIDYFPDWISSGVFGTYVMSWCPWVEEMKPEELKALDIEYFGNRSGYKQASPLLDKIAGRLDNRQLGNASRRLDVRCQMLRNILKSMYGYEWNKLWNIWKATYDPTYNYDIWEEKQGSHSENKNKSTETAAKSETDMSTVNSVKPLNTNAFEPLTKSESDMDTTRSMISNRENEGTDIEGEDEYKKHRYGNVGTMPYQDLVQKEIDLRKQKFFDIIMSDLDRVLTIPYWE